MAPVLVGTAAAAHVIAWRAAAALVVALALQVAVNYANDYFDGVAGIDTDDRLGPRRMVAIGLVPAATMKRAMVAALLVAGVVGGVLVLATDWRLAGVGIVSAAAALGYSGGGRPYASRGLGEVFVFVFFGLVATVGTQFVQDLAWSWVAFTAAFPIGLLAVGLLVVNNLRDIPTDEATGKVTLAVRLGEAGTRELFRTLLLGSAAGVVVTAFVAASPWALVALAAFALAPPLWRVVRTGEGRELLPALAMTARLQLVVAVLLSVGLVLAP